MGFKVTDVLLTLLIYVKEKNRHVYVLHFYLMINRTFGPNIEFVVGRLLKVSLGISKEMNRILGQRFFLLKKMPIITTTRFQ